MIPDAAIGAVIAALVGGMISLVGLIIAKESKVSEFRQSWIDKLRGELSLFITHLTAMEDAGRVRFADDKERFEKTRDSVGRLNEAYFTIALRLNPAEAESNSVKSSMIALSNMAKDPFRNEVDYGQEKVNFLNMANALLKAEWVRVRDGERIYQKTRRAAIGIVSVLAIAVLAMTVWGKIYPAKKAEATPQNVTIKNYQGDVAPDSSPPHKPAVHNLRGLAEKNIDRSKGKRDASSGGARSNHE